MTAALRELHWLPIAQRIEFKVLTLMLCTVPCTITLRGTYLIGYRHMLHLALFVRELNRWLPFLGSTLNAMAGERSRVRVPPVEFAAIRAENTERPRPF